MGQVTVGRSTHPLIFPSFWGKNIALLINMHGYLFHVSEEISNQDIPSCVVVYMKM